MNERKEFLIVDTESNFIDFRKVDLILDLVKAIQTKEVPYGVGVGAEFYVKVNKQGHICLFNDENKVYIYSLQQASTRVDSFPIFWQIMRSHFKFYVVK